MTITKGSTLPGVVLSKGENTTLTSGKVTLSVGVTTIAIDVSALLLGSAGKVRSDADLVFYNNPSHDGVVLAGSSIDIALHSIPVDVDKVVLVASADPLHPGAVFTKSPRLTVTGADGTSVEFQAPDFADRETVVVLAEVYRRNGEWKVRAIGQGYAAGLAGLAADYGVDVEDDAPVPLAAGPDLTKIGSRAPALLPVARSAGEALMSAGLGGKRAAVYLVLDHSYEMKEMYESFAVQAFAERVLALSANLDDDGTVPIVFSGERTPFVEEMRLDNYRGRIAQLHTQVDWGWGQVDEAMRCVINHYQESMASDPALVIVQVGNEPDDKAAVRTLLQNSAALGVFWIFVGFGRGKLAFFKNLNSSTSARFGNAAFYNVGQNPGAVPNEKFYQDLLNGFDAWAQANR
ncbi:VWA domain-containing protein [Nocardia asteroides]|uniref:VWA domain-containing protein n=1 Tax=Nocardia asteroides TaxID=1824 RepID=UPI0033EACAEC